MPHNACIARGGFLRAPNSDAGCATRSAALPLKLDHEPQHQDHDGDEANAREPKWGLGAATARRCSRSHTVAPPTRAIIRHARGVTCRVHRFLTSQHSTPRNVLT